MKAKESEKPFRVGRSQTGLGLFATDEIRKGAFIIEYIGPRLSNEAASQRRNTRYLFEVNSRWTIDGSPRWNTARYINHSCRPNAQAVVSRGRIRIKAIKRIGPGTRSHTITARTTSTRSSSRSAANARRAWQGHPGRRADGSVPSLLIPTLRQIPPDGFL